MAKSEFAKLNSLLRKTCANFTPPEILTVSEWSDKYRVLSRENAAEAGRWRTSRTPYLKEIMDSFNDPRVQKVYIMACSQVGKALDVKTPIPTPTGFIPMGELKVGDIVYDENGKACTVTFATDTMYNHKCYEVTFSDNSKLVADAEHRWYVESDLPLSYPNGKNRSAVYSGVLTTQQIADTCHYTRGRGKNEAERNRYAIPVARAIEGTEKELLIQPYTLGVWLGDGHSFSAQFCGHLDDSEIIENVEKDGYIVDVVKGENRNYNAKIHMPYINTCLYGHDKDVYTNEKGRCRKCTSICSTNSQIKKGVKKGLIVKRERVKPLSFSERLTALNVMGNKHIPREYLRASIKQRYELLQGLMDTDGYCSTKGRCEITLTSKQLIDGVCELLASLGVKYTMTKKDCVCSNAIHNRHSVGYKVSFLAYNDKQIFKLSRKQARLVSKTDGYRRTTETERRRIIDVKEVETRPVRCIQVDSPNHLYLAGKEMIPTHNTEFMLNCLAFVIDNDPGGVLFVFPTLEQANDFSKRRLAPMIRDTLCLRRKITPPKSRDSNNSIRAKTFPGGMLSLAGSNSPGDLASKPCRYVFMDEMARFAASAGTEGSPAGLAEARTATFYNKKIIGNSTPTIRGATEIESNFYAGTQEYWNYECPNCKKYHQIWFKDTRFEYDSTTEGHKKIFHVKSVHYKCPECGELFTESEMKKQPAKWIAENPEAYKNGIRTFWLNGFCSPWLRWDYIILRFLEAGKDREKLKTVWNTLFGELWEDRGDMTTEDELMKRREEYTSELPDGVLFLTCAVDTQDNRLEYEVKGWGHFKESWGIKKGYIMGRPDNPYVWARLDDIVDHQYKTKNGKVITISITLVDSGGHFTQEVYSNCRARTRKRVFAIKGRGRKDLGQAIPFINPPKKEPYGPNGQFRTWLYTLGVNSGKRDVQDFININQPGAMFCHFPSNADCGYDFRYFSGLLSEVEVIKDNKVEWNIIPGHERNEPFDLFVYNYAGLRIVDPDMDELEKRLLATTETKTRVVKKKKSIKRNDFDDFL